MIYFATLMFFVLDYLRPGSYIPGLDSLHLNSIVPLFAIVGTLIKKTPVSNEEYFSDTNAKLMGALLGLLVISTLFAPVTLYAYTVTKNVFAYVLISWVVVRNVGDQARLKGVFIALAAVHVAVAVLNPTIFTNPDSRVGINSGAFLGDGNDFSLSVNICIPLLLFVMLESKRKLVKLVLAVALLALVFAVVATKSRGGTLALAAVMGYFWLGSKRKAVLAAIFVLVVAVALAFAPPLYFERMGQMTDTEEGSAAGRIEAWKQSVNMAVRNPLLGAGAGHFGSAYGIATQSTGMTAHSIYFLILGELGVPGLVLLLTYIFSNLAANRRLLSSIRQLPGEQALTAHNLLNCTNAALIAFATGGAFLSAVYYPHLYVLAALLASGRLVVRNEIAALAQSGPDQLAAATQPILLTLGPGAISPEWVPRPHLYTRASGDRR